MLVLPNMLELIEKMDPEKALPNWGSYSAMCYMLCQERFRLVIRKNLFLWKSGEILEEVAQGGGIVTIPGGCQEKCGCLTEWHGSDELRVGLDNLSGLSFQLKWSYDSVTGSWFYLHIHVSILWYFSKHYHYHNSLTVLHHDVVWVVLPLTPFDYLILSK